MSSKSFPLDLPLLNSGDPCGVAATLSHDPEPGSGIWVKGKRINKYTDKELVQLLKFASDKHGNARHQYSICVRHKKAYWFNEIRGWGGLWKRCNEEMKRRDILHDPQGKWDHATGRKGDTAGL